MTLDGIRMRQQASLAGRCNVTRGRHPNVTTVHSALECLVRPAGSRGTQEEEVAGGGQVSVPLSLLRVPATADVRRGDVVEMTSSPRDPQFADRWFTVVSSSPDSFATTRLLQMREVQP